MLSHLDLLCLSFRASFSMTQLSYGINKYFDLADFPLSKCVSLKDGKDSISSSTSQAEARIHDIFDKQDFFSFY